MKHTSTHISIPTPCHELWEHMNPTERGAFCLSCQKEVIDFSTMTDREVIEYLSKNKIECGRFRKDQVDRSLSVAMVRNGWLKWKAFVIASLSLVVFKNSAAQKNQPSTIQIGKTRITETTGNSSHKITISGIVRDSISHKVLPLAEIAVRESPAKTSWEKYAQQQPPAEEVYYLEGNNNTKPAIEDTITLRSEYTDTTGHFSFKAEGLVKGHPVTILVHADGYIPKEIAINPNQAVQQFTIDLIPVDKEFFHFIMGKMKL